MSDSKVRWGIIGLGKIAHKFAQDLLLAEDAVLAGVASRNLEKAKAFGEQYHAQQAFGSYEELISNPTIEVVYIATPHVMHGELSLKCMEAGKAVLCEKPMSMSVVEAEAMIEASKKHQVFFMEALWTRFMPTVQVLVDLIEEGRIGEIKSLRADFGFQAKYNPSDRVFDKSLGGGSLLDIGIYPIFFAQLLLGSPQRIQAQAVFGETGVDHSCSMLFGYDSGAIAVLDSTLMAHTPIEAWVHGTKGSIKLHRRFHHAEKLSVWEEGNAIEEIATSYVGNGYYHEILEVMDCLREGRIESLRFSHENSLALARSLERVAQEIGLAY